MKKLIPVILLFYTFTYAQSKSIFEEGYYDHWETVNPTKSLLEIIIYKNKQTTRVVELDFNSKCGDLGAAILFPTVYVHKMKNETMAVETINISTMELQESNYVLTNDDHLLRVTKNDTVVFKRRN